MLHENPSFRKIDGGVFATVAGRELFLPGITMDDIADGWRAYQTEHIQDAFSFLDDAQRKFLMTGTLPGEWEELTEE